VVDALAQDPASEPLIGQLQQLMTDLGVDPVTWMIDPKVVGREKIDGVKVFHTAGKANMAKMITDLIQMSQSEQFTNMLGSAGADDSSGLGSTLPTPEELAQQQAQIEALFKDNSIEMWTEEETSMLRKVLVTATLDPSAQEGCTGMKSAKLKVLLTLGDVNKPPSIKPPGSALPFSDLEKTM
jgi:hypothetical protein